MKKIFNISTKLHFFEYSKESLQKNFAIVYSKDTDIADFAKFAGGKDFDVSPTSIKVITDGYDVTEFKDRAIGFPNGNIDGVAGVKDMASGGDMN